MRDQLFRLAPSPDASLQARIREMLVRGILDGQLPPGTALPSGRRLARQLDVARNTVVLAYQQLVDEGFLVARERSGYYVAPDVVAGRIDARTGVQASAERAPDWSARLRLAPTAQRNIRKPADWKRYPYPFVSGQFDPALFPIPDWRECAREAVSVRAIGEWAGDRVDRDDPLLVELIRTRLLPRRGVWAAADQVLVTLGAQQALYLLADLLVSRGTAVGIENPGYPDARNIFGLRGADLVGLGIDTGGVVIDRELDRCRYVFVTPSHQSPTTVTMSLARREQLLARAREHDIVVIEDDYEAETNFVGEPTPALKSLDTDGRVIYVGSLSKSLAPGLRLGYMVAPAPLIEEARALRRLMLRHPPANNQLIVALFLKRGHHDSLVRRLSHAYRDRWQAMGDALSRHLPDAFGVPTFGGTAFWVRGPRWLDARALLPLAEQHGLLFEPGDVYYLDAGGPRNFLRLGFSSIGVDRIEPGIQLLARLIAEARPQGALD